MTTTGQQRPINKAKIWAEWENLTEKKRQEYIEMYAYGDIAYSDMRRFMPHAAAAYKSYSKEKS